MKSTVLPGSSLLSGVETDPSKRLTNKKISAAYGIATSASIFRTERKNNPGKQKKLGEKENTTNNRIESDFLRNYRKVKGALTF